MKPKGQVLKGSWGWAWQDHRLGEDVEGGSPAVLRVSAGEGDAAHWVMAAKKKPVRRRVGKESHTQISGLVLMWGSPVVGADLLSLVVCQCDALGRDFEVDHSWCWAGAAAQSCRASLGHSLRASQ